MNLRVPLSATLYLNDIRGHRHQLCASQPEQSQMAGLIVLALAVGWLILSGSIAGGIARVIVPERMRRLSAVLLYPLVLAIPFADEAIGRWQFNRLCEREAKVWIAPTAKQVQAARRVGPDFVDRRGFLIPVQEQPIVYVDAHTGQPRASSTSFSPHFTVRAQDFTSPDAE